jgi:hypothetical protein
MGEANGGARQVRLVRGPAPAALTEALGVLRGGRTEADELPESALGRLGFSQIWGDAVRHLATNAKWDMRVFLVAGLVGAEARAPEAAQTRAGTSEPLVMLDVYQAGGRVGAKAYSVDQVLAGRLVSIFGPPLWDNELVYGLVPDGVSSVEVKAGDMPAKTEQVKGNFFEVEAPVPMSQGPANSVTSVTTTMTWYDSSGDILKTVSRTQRHTRLSFTAQVQIPEG